MGGFHSVTYGDKKFINRAMDPRSFLAEDQ